MNGWLNHKINKMVIYPAIKGRRRGQRSLNTLFCRFDLRTRYIFYIIINKN